MIAQRSRGLFALHTCIQIACALALFWGGIGLLDPVLGVMRFTRLDRYALYSLVIAASLGGEAFLGPKPTLPQLGLFASLQRGFRQTLAALIFLLVFLVATKDPAISRLFLCAYFPALWGLLSTLNRVLPKALAAVFFQGNRAELALLAGPWERALKLHAWLERHAEYGIRAAGLLSEDPVPYPIPGLPRLGTLDALPAAIAQTGVRQVVLVEIPDRQVPVGRLAAACEALGARLTIVSDLEERLGRRAIVTEESGLLLVTLRPEPLENPVNRLLKRLFDLTIAIPGLLIAMPAAAVLVWILHRLQSPGPLLYRQKRTGLHGREFEICKFRTMHARPFDENRQAQPGDERIFRAGHWLRQFCIDEIPQLWNVLKGEMSIVGPRPHLPAHDALFSQDAYNYRVRSLIKPGMTGLAQVRGHRGHVIRPSDVTARIQSDIDYLENWSLMLDATIVLRTLVSLIIPPSQTRS